MNPEDYKSYFEANKDGWNKRTAIHKDSDFYNVAGFKEGKTSLNELEINEVGTVHGKKLLHLQCHFGMDTLSWARMGAIATGVDMSDNAIEVANQLSKDIHVTADFICCNVYDLKDYLHEKFDIIYTSYGVIGWLPDLTKWAETINHFLKPGGTFYMAEFHPVVWMMDENFERIKYYYHNQEMIYEKQTGTYTDRNAPIEYEDYTWNHSLSEVINSLIYQGLQIQSLTELPYSFYNCFNNMVQGTDSYWRIKGIENKVPMIYSIRALKK